MSTPFSHDRPTPEEQADTLKRLASHFDRQKRWPEQYAALIVESDMWEEAGQHVAAEQARKEAERIPSCEVCHEPTQSFVDISNVESAHLCSIDCVEEYVAPENWWMRR